MPKTTPAKAFEALEALAKSTESVRIERKVFTVEAAAQEAAADIALSLTRTGPWQMNLHLSGLRRTGGKPLFDFVIERVVK